MKLSLLSRAAAVAILGSASFLPMTAFAGDCFEDPIYERNWVGSTVSGARIRSVACMAGSEVLTTVGAGTKLSIIGETDGWYKVKSGSTVGWMGATLVKVTDTSGTATPIKETVAVKPTMAEKEKIATGLASKPVGISEDNYAKLKAKRADLLKQLRGKVILRVHARGQAYFVEKNGTLTPFTKAQLEAYLKKAKTVSEKPTPVSSQNGTIALSGKVDDYGSVELNWTLSNMTSEKGFKVVVSAQENPVYPGNDARYLSDASMRSDEWHDLKAGKTYYFRICEYLGNGCGVYSNNVKVTIPADATNMEWSEKTETKTEKPAYVSATADLKLAAEVLAGKVILSWTPSVAAKFDGYKVVRSTSDADLSYPKSSYRQYITERSSVNFLDADVVAGKSYYYRICALGGEIPACGNVIQVTTK